MAKFVIAGSCDCPYYAKLELLADKLSSNLPEFKVHKIVLPSNKWEGWLSDTCSENGWMHKKSPIVWRELVDRGGKGMLVGGFNEFMEYANCYYGNTSDMMTDLMLKIKDENITTNYAKAKEKEYIKSLSKPIHICITNASSSVAYHMIPSIASGYIFGKEVEISLRFLDHEKKRQHLEGVCMEAIDLAYPCLKNVTICTEPKEAFRDAAAVIFLEDEKCDTDDEKRHKKLQEYADQYKLYAEILDQVALNDVKIIVAGNGFVNFNTYVLVEHTSNINKQNIVATARLKERQAKALLSRKLNVNSAGIKNVISWGNCANDANSESIYLDISAGCVHGYDSAVWGPEWFSRPLLEMIYDNKWLSNNFISDHNVHMTSLEGDLRHSASMSEATSIVTLLHDWVHGSGTNEMSSLGVKCEGWYGISNCVFSLPVRFTEGSYQVVWDIEVDPETKDKLKRAEANLKKDVRAVFQIEEEEKEVFGEEAQIISSMMSPVESPNKVAGEKLEVIQEEEAEAQEDETE
ncbi:unnamed protein product [Clavelina lepadiformis]|uniref:Lactate/malate dehydrogenase C-terminal domain-containing protein n=1 Tax=Clavelina lepadiformis TaxID=159417 RepID=A0ABP0GGA9_CLALP